MREELFIEAYNNYVDEIFEYCYKRVADRDVAKYMTRVIFMRAWDRFSSANGDIALPNTLAQIAKDHVRGYISNRRKVASYSGNLWNLTLMQ